MKLRQASVRPGPPMRLLDAVAAQTGKPDRAPLAHLVMNTLEDVTRSLLDKNAGLPTTITPGHLQMRASGGVQPGSLGAELPLTDRLGFMAPELVTPSALPWSRFNPQAAQVYSLGATALSLARGGASPFRVIETPERVEPGQSGITAAYRARGGRLRAYQAHRLRPLSRPEVAESGAVETALDLLRGYGDANGLDRELAARKGRPESHATPPDRLKNLVLAMVDPEPQRRPSLLQVQCQLAAIRIDLEGRTWRQPARQVTAKLTAATAA